MIRIDQTDTSRETGNCMQAVLASLFEKELSETVNTIVFNDNNWYKHFFSWVESVGYSYCGVMNQASTKEQTYLDLACLYAVGGFFYASVPSKTHHNETHAVIINRAGRVVHDPNPDKKWLGINVVDSRDLLYWYMFEPANNNLI